MLNHALRVAAAGVAIALATFNLSSLARAATVNYVGLGTSTVPWFSTGGITATGSANVNVLNDAGLGIFGGAFDFLVDGVEFIDFTFAVPAINVSYVVGGVEDTGTIGIGAERFLEVFAVGGGSLGVVHQDNYGPFDVTSIFSDATIERFRVTADLDQFRIESVSFDVAVIPLPAALPLFAGGLGLLGLLGWRRKRMTKPKLFADFFLTHGHRPANGRCRQHGRLLSR